MFKLITELLNAVIGKNTKYTKKNTDFKRINITNYKTCKK